MLHRTYLDIDVGTGMILPESYQLHPDQTVYRLDLPSNLTVRAAVIEMLSRATPADRSTQARLYGTEVPRIAA